MCAAASEEGELILRGIVVPTDWDGDGVVRRVSILTSDEGEYDVVPRGAGARLATHLRCEVLARAVHAGPGASSREVRITSFAVLEWDDRGEDEIPA